MAWQTSTSSRRWCRGVALVPLAVAVFAACGDDGPNSAGEPAQTPTDSGMEMHDDDAHADDDDMESYAFGEPADAADANRVIEIEGKDDFTFEPASVTVSAGDVVTFRVTNVGVLPHDFTLGDTELQDEHDAEMAQMSSDQMDMHEEPNAFTLGPGETKEMTWHLTEPGELIYGCHIPGHYAAGMRGTIVVEA